MPKTTQTNISKITPAYTFFKDTKITQKDYKHLGPKTINLKKCQDLKFKVPKFVAIPSFVCQEILTDSLESSSEKTKQLKQFCHKIHQELNCQKYAVRSSSLNEDGTQKSQVKLHKNSTTT